MGALSEHLSNLQSSEPQWSQPEIFDLKDPLDEQKCEEALLNGSIVRVTDPLRIIAANLFEYEHPAYSEKVDSGRARADFCESLAREGEKFGNWVLYPWSGNLVRFPEVDDLRKLRTARNRDLITPEEQRKLFDSSVAVFGLSVGGNVVDRLVQGGICGKVIFGDMDTLEIPNLNRLNASYTQIGTTKVDILAKRISETDPYLEQIHFKGVS